MRSMGLFFRIRRSPIGRLSKEALWKLPQLRKSNKEAFGSILLMISTSCLEKPPLKNALRLYHSYHKASDGIPFGKRQKPQTQDSTYSHIQMLAQEVLHLVELQRQSVKRSDRLEDTMSLMGQLLQRHENRLDRLEGPVQ